MFGTGRTAIASKGEGEYRFARRGGDGGAGKTIAALERLMTEVGELRAHPEELEKLPKDVG
jgi:hypothetical protein